MDHRPLDRLLEVMEAARCGGSIPAQAAEWLVDGLEAYLGGEPLDRSLGLGGFQSQPHASTQFRKLLRNHHLKKAYAMCDGASPPERAENLRLEIFRFETRIWKRWESLSAPPDGASQLRTHLWHAFKAGRVPSSARQLERICSPDKSHPVQCHDLDAILNS